MTINEALAVGKSVRERITDLEEMRRQSVVETKHYDIDGKLRQDSKVLVDVKDIDKRIVLLQNFLLKVDASVKKANAVTAVPELVDVNVDTLLAPLA